MISTSRAFDRAASVYDQTRPLPEPIATHGIPAILDVAGRDARILEAGTGTGRIGVPLLERGANVIGCDLSAKMLARFQDKIPSARLAQADAGYLPFRASHFDAVLTAHVMHLVGPWREALREFRRVLKPGGVYLNVRTWEPVGVSVREQVRVAWRSWMAARGIDGRHPGVQSREDLLHELKQMGARVTEVEAVRFTHTYTLREELERFETRVYSDTWSMPDAVFNESVHDLRARLIRDHDDLDHQLEDAVRFAIDVACFEG